MSLNQLRAPFLSRALLSGAPGGVGGLLQALWSLERWKSETRGSSNLSFLDVQSVTNAKTSSLEIFGRSPQN